MQESNEVSSASEDGVRVEYDARTQTHRAHYDFSGSVTPSTAVLETVATIEDVDPIELDPLFESVDPDVIDALFEPSTGRSIECITFVFTGYEVTVHGDGTIAVTDAHS